MRRSIIGITILGLIGIGLYSISGLPIPQWFSREAVQRRNQLNLMVLARIVCEMDKESNSLPKTWKDITTFCRKQNMTYDIDELQKELPGESTFQFSSTSIEIGTVILRGQVPDAYGLVWVLTDNGNVIKIPATIRGEGVEQKERLRSRTGQEGTRLAP